MAQQPKVDRTTTPPSKKENDWISVKKELPEIPSKSLFIMVKVRTKHNGIGEMIFGYSGAMGEPMIGSFWYPIRNFHGEVHLDNEIIDWKYIQ